MVEKEVQLVRGLKLFDATTIVIGSVIGSGIFIAPSLMAGYINSPGLMILLWIIGGILTICGALSCGELAASMPKAGGQYVFLREAFSPFWGFIFGWSLFFIIQTGFIAAVSVAFAKYFGVFIPWISENTILFKIAFTGFSFALNSAQLVGIVSILVLTAINICGLKAGAFVQNLFTVLKVLGILILTASAFLLYKNGSVQNFAPIWEPLVSSGVKIGLFAAIAVAMSKALFAYDAWYTVTFVAGEIDNPKKNLPLSLLTGTLTIMLVYVLAVCAYIYVLPLNQMANVADNRVAADVAHIIFGDIGLNFIAIAIVISTFGCNNGLILGGARVFYAMAKDGFFLKPASEINSKFKSPVNSLIYQAIWASILTLSGKYSDLLTYTAFASLLFNAMSVVGLFVLRKKRPDMPRPYKTWGYPVVPLLYILISLFFLVYIVIGDPRNSLMGLILISIGIPVYFINKNKTKNQNLEVSR